MKFKRGWGRPRKTSIVLATSVAEKRVTFQLDTPSKGIISNSEKVTSAGSKKEAQSLAHNILKNGIEMSKETTKDAIKQGGNSAIVSATKSPSAVQQLQAGKETKGKRFVVRSPNVPQATDSNARHSQTESNEEKEMGSDNCNNNSKLMMDKHDGNTSHIHNGDGCDKECATNSHASADENDEDLYCSICWAPFTVDKFYSHLVSTHKKELLSKKKYSIPVLLPRNHNAFSSKSLVYLEELVGVPKKRGRKYNAINEIDETVQFNNILIKTDPAKTQRLSIIRHLDLMPDVNDPNYYCRACERTSRDRNAFRIHLIRIHQIPLKPLGRAGPPIINPHIQPDPRDPNYFCAACEKIFATKTTFLTHISFVHHVSVETAGSNKRGKASVLCHICKKSHQYLCSLRQHLIDEHQMEYQSPDQLVNSNKSSGSTAQAYSKAMVIREASASKEISSSITQVQKRDVKVSGALPTGNVNSIFMVEVGDKAMVVSPSSTRTDKDDGNGADDLTDTGSSGSADKAMANLNVPTNDASSSSTSKAVSKVVVNQDTMPSEVKSESSLRTSSKIIVHPDLIPDQNNPNYYCRACDRYSQNLCAFRIHLQRVHKMKLKEIGHKKPIINPHLVPDINDPNLFCIACETSFSSYPSFKSHLRHTHNMEDISRRRAPKKRRAPPSDTPYRVRPQKKNTAYNDDKVKMETPPQHLLDFGVAGPSTTTRISDNNNSNLKSTRVHKRTPILYHNVMPDINDLNHYCAACDRRYPVASAFRAHLYKYHNFSEVPTLAKRNGRAFIDYRCEECDMKFSSRDTSDSHLQDHHEMTLAPPSNIEDFTCNKCDRLYNRRIELENHSTHIHGLPPKPDMSVTTTANRRTTKTRNDTSSSSSSITTQVANKNHRALRLKKRKCECDICGKIFDNRYLLGVHRERSHNIHFVYDDEYFYCNLCNTTLGGHHAYDLHLKNIHMLDNLPENLEYGTPSDSKQQQQQQQSQKKPAKEAKFQVKGLTPDVDDPSCTYCRPCDLTYSSSVHYRLHLFRYHKLAV